MITLTRTNGQSVLLNCDLIELVESNEDNSVVTLTTGNAIIVREPPSEIEAKVMEFKRRIAGAPAP